MADIQSQPNDSTEVSLRKAVSLLGNIEDKTNTLVVGELEVKNTSGDPLAVSGTVTATLADQQYDSGTPVFVPAYFDSPGGSVIPVSQDANAGMPISGSVTASLSENAIIEGSTERMLGATGGVTLSGGVGLAFNSGGAANIVGTNNPLPISGTVDLSAGSIADLDISEQVRSGVFNWADSELSGNVQAGIGVRNASEFEAGISLIRAANFPANFTNFNGFYRLDYARRAYNEDGLYVVYRHCNAVDFQEFTPLLKLERSSGQWAWFFTAEENVCVKYISAPTNGTYVSPANLNNFNPGDLGGLFTSVYVVRADAIPTTNPAIGNTHDFPAVDAQVDTGASGSSLISLGKGIFQKLKLVPSIGTNTDTSAASDTGNHSLFSFFKRLLSVKLPNAVSGRVPVDGSGITQPISATSLPLPEGTVNQSAWFAYSGTGTHAAFDCGADADYVYIYLNGGGGGYTHNLQLSANSAFAPFTDLTSGNVLYQERMPTQNLSTNALNFSNAGFQSGTTGLYVLSLHQAGSGPNIKNRWIRVSVTGGGGGGWSIRYVSVRAPYKGQPNNFTNFPGHRTLTHSIVDINSTLRELPVAVTGTAQTSDRGSTGPSTVITFSSVNSVELRPANVNRKLLTIFNEGAGTLHVLYGDGTASTTNYSVRLASGDYLEIEKYTGRVMAIFATAGNAKVTEITT